MSPRWNKISMLLYILRKIPSLSNTWNSFLRVLKSVYVERVLSTKRLVANNIQIFLTAIETHEIKI